MNKMTSRFALLFLAVPMITGCAVEKESMSIFLAKEACSCLFVVGQTESNCRSAIRLPLALGDIKIDFTKKQVTGTAEDKSHPATVSFVSEKFGCALRE